MYSNGYCKIHCMGVLTCRLRTDKGPSYDELEREVVHGVEEEEFRPLYETDYILTGWTSGPRARNSRGPGTTVNQDNAQFSDLGRLSWPKRAEINACFNFPPFLQFLTPNKAGIFSGTIFFVKLGKPSRTVFRTRGMKSRGFAQNRPDFRGKNVFECQIKDEEVI